MGKVKSHSSTGEEGEEETKKERKTTPAPLIGRHMRPEARGLLRSKKK
jgi:hypothetical protein